MTVIPTSQTVRFEPIAADVYSADLLSKRGWSDPGTRLIASLFRFRHTYWSLMPLARTFVWPGGLTRPGRSPTLTAYRARSVVERTPDTMAQLRERYHYHAQPEFHFAGDAFALNFIDQYLFILEVPGVGAVGYAEAPTQELHWETDANGYSQYRHSLVLTPFDAPKTLAALSEVATCPLPALPPELRSRRPQATEPHELVWRPGHDETGSYFVDDHTGRFIEVISGAAFEFHELAPGDETKPDTLFLRWCDRTGNLRKAGA